MTKATKCLDTSILEMIAKSTKHQETSDIVSDIRYQMIEVT